MPMAPLKDTNMKRLLILFILPLCWGCAELQQVASQLPQQGVVSNADIANGLKQALDLGITQQVSKLAGTDGFYGNTLVRIALPKELQKVDKTLRDIGLSSLADEGVKMLNRAAEDAVGTAIPIFTNAVKGITFNDARNILMGSDNAATQYLQGTTQTALYDSFSPIIQDSFQKVGADTVWTNLITKYNSLPFVQKVNPDLTDYVTQEALNGVYTMIAVEEKDIRTNIKARTTDLLRKVFGLQDQS